MVQDPIKLRLTQRCRHAGAVVAITGLLTLAVLGVAQWLGVLDSEPRSFQADYLRSDRRNDLPLQGPARMDISFASPVRFSALDSRGIPNPRDPFWWLEYDPGICPVERPRITSAMSVETAK